MCALYYHCKAPADKVREVVLKNRDDQNREIQLNETQLCQHQGKDEMSSNHKLLDRWEQVSGEECIEFWVE